MNVELIGWLASLLLITAIGLQLRAQWRHGADARVTPWLFVGNGLASAGFVVYAWLLDNPVFIFTNTLLLLAAAIGLHLRLRGDRSSSEPRSKAARAAEAPPLR